MRSFNCYKDNSKTTCVVGGFKIFVTHFFHGTLLSMIFLSYHQSSGMKIKVEFKKIVTNIVKPATAHTLLILLF
jgi:hypothetical protein